ARGINATTVGQTVSLMIAPLVIVPLAVHWGWRSTFYINGFIGLFWVWICYAWFRNNPSEMKGIGESEKLYIEEHRKFQSHSKEFTLKSALKNPNVLFITAINFCANWGFYFFIAWLPIYLREGRNFSEEEMKWTIS